MDSTNTPQSQFQTLRAFVAKAQKQAHGLLCDYFDENLPKVQTFQTNFA